MWYIFTCSSRIGPAAADLSEMMMVMGSSPLKDKVVLITGAGSGIGQGVAVRFAGLGCRLALAGRNAERLYHTADLCCKAGATTEKILLLPGDVTNEESVKSIIQKSFDRFKRLDILLNNAGVCMTDDIEHTSLEHFDTIMNTNVRGPFFMTMLAAPHIIRSRGVIINISSTAGLHPVRDLLTYGMSKAAMDHFTKTLALELGPKGVRVNSIKLAPMAPVSHGHLTGRGSTAPRPLYNVVPLGFTHRNM